MKEHRQAVLFFVLFFFFHFPSRGESAQHTGLKKASDKHRPNTPLNKYN